MLLLVLPIWALAAGGVLGQSLKGMELSGDSLQRGPYGPRLTILAVPGLRASDLTSPSVPLLQSLAQSSAVGWMNCRVARAASRDQEGEAAAWVTLGAGARAAAPPDLRITGADSLPAAVRRIRATNAGLDHEVTLGLLAKVVRRAGLKTYAIGDEDALQPDRGAWLMLADSAGAIDAPVDLATSTKAHVPLEPYGRLTPATVLPGDQGTVSLLVFGDLARVNQYEPLCTPDAAAGMRERALGRLDGILKALVMYGEGHPSLILLSPASGAEDERTDRLAPILISAPRFTQGLVTSGSTRTPGLIANTDVLPTIAAMLGVKPPAGLVGRAATSTGKPADVRAWRGLHDGWVARARVQALIGGLPVVQAVLLALSVIGWWRRTDRWRRVAQGCAGVVLALPAIGLLAPVLGVASVPGSVLALLAACAIAGGLCAWSDRGARIVLVGGVALALGGCLVSLVGRTRWLDGAWMGFSVMEGARYYGVGNEYAAVLGACLLVALASATRANGRVALSIATAVVVVGLVGAAIVGWSGMGANAGGAAGLALGAAVLGVALRRDRVRARDVALAAGEVVGMLVLALVADLLRSPADQSHIARALVATDGPLQIAVRKGSMNLWLLFHSPWTPLLAIGLAGFAALGWQGVRERDPRAWWAARASIFWLAAGLFVLNDSGVVAAAECLGVGAAALGLWAAVPRLDTDGPVSVN